MSRTRLWHVGTTVGLIGLGIGFIGGAYVSAALLPPAAPAVPRAPGAQSAAAEATWTLKPARIDAAERDRLARIEAAPPPAPVAPPAQVAQRVAPTPTLRFAGVTVIDAGTFRTAEITAVLADVAVPAAGALCTDDRPGQWRCGARARDVFARITADRVLDCTPRGMSEGRSVLACAIDNTDLATWMTRQGWLTPVDGAPRHLIEAHESARAERIGMFAADFRSTRRQEAESRIPSATTADVRPAR